MIEHKKALYRAGLEMFLYQYCGGNRDAYIYGMVQMNGYLDAAKQFFKYSGYMTREDATGLIDRNEMPSWIVEVILSFEQDVFGTTLYDKQ